MHWCHLMMATLKTHQGSPKPSNHLLRDKSCSMASRVCHQTHDHLPWRPLFGHYSELVQPPQL